MSQRAPAPTGRCTLGRPLPVSLDTANPMSWRLGERNTDDAATLGEWEHASGRVVTIFEATPDTAILRCKTPAGRERYYGIARIDLEREIEAFERSDGWRGSADGL
ncbi:hypothetical protein ACFQDG_03735 [Natronoarchaeum mannanilyticum]|uniref:Uncharacterized protein n=1 Tax=Natronoarchaeum mannanilyticum TaxID=926360 RepID=A0AAV3T824_9EURY